MSTLVSLARALAVERGVAQPITTVRHVHVHERPLVLVPLTLAGEANAPLAAMVGTAPDDARLLVVAQPRNRDERFGFAAELAAILVSYVDSFTGQVEAVVTNRGRDIRSRYTDGPQLIVPNPAGAGFVKLFGRSTRLRRTDGPWAVAPTVPLAGRWLTFFAERYEHPGSAALVAVTSALTAHWATGQSALEDANLAALMGWIDPPAGLTGAQAAAAAEDPLTWPPAGPITDPTFDNEVLAALMEAYANAPGERTLATLTTAIRGQIEPTWRLVWRAVELLRALPPGERVAQRWAADRDAYSAMVMSIVDGRPPQPRRDGAVAAAGRLNRLERDQASYDVQRAFDDPLVLAEYRLSGEAFAGVVTAAQPDRVDASGRRRVLRPHVTVLTDDPVRFTPGAALTSPARPAQKATVVAVGAGDTSEVVLELSGGMGSSLQAPPGTVPEVGEQVVYSSLADDYQQAPEFPAREDTPWTHGGPPPEYVPTDEDAAEEWS
ncbi:hypothetical protein [Luedemannella helvata]|uniref:Uncharacterized protein n=1 Tax=Luedemannella helvata TaxID=349315 RepID=A0ABP4VW48_9ACTN